MIFPHDVARGRHLEEAADLAFVDEGVAVGQAARIADMRAAKRPAGLTRTGAGILPDDFLRHRIDFENRAIRR